MEFLIKLLPQDVEAIGRALAERPYREVAALIAKLDAQLAAQQQKPEAPKADEPPKGE